MMSAIQRCEDCGKETAVEGVLPGVPVKCIDCGFEKQGDGSGNSTWLNVPSNDNDNTGPHAKLMREIEVLEDQKLKVVD